jgi:hypothetical protein
MPRTRADHGHPDGQTGTRLLAIDVMAISILPATIDVSKFNVILVPVTVAIVLALTNVTRFSVTELGVPTVMVLALVPPEIKLLVSDTAG